MAGRKGGKLSVAEKLLCPPFYSDYFSISSTTHSLWRGVAWPLPVCCVCLARLDTLYCADLLCVDYFVSLFLFLGW